jgi:hypothetical protein
MQSYLPIADCCMHSAFTPSIRSICSLYPPIPTTFSAALTRSKLMRKEPAGGTAPWFSNIHSSVQRCGVSNIFQLKNDVSKPMILTF